ncbi:hypothetical protein UFOVP84_27 [uncultured Caudovirales phage]|uniref:Holin n=1 Tax=uncultured Caudovirales phage TaxID=2100421 RepID=A0A6J5L2U6_9CAUD|nr:hypothetical protein UFOVP84_27 [uncultured Caudovirales phage]
MKVNQLLEVFNAGKAVANPEAWKKHTVTVNTLLVLISGCLAILHYFDCSICTFDLTSEQQMSIATFVMTIFGIFNAGSTIVTTEKIGFKPKNLQPIEEVDPSLANDIKDLQ